MTTISASPESTWVRGLRRFSSGVDKFLNVFVWLSAASIALMTIHITLEVIVREVFHLGQIGAVEFSGYLLVAVTFLAASYSLRDGAFIRVSAVIERMPLRARRVLQLIYDVVGLAFVSLLFYFGLRLWIQSFTRGTTSIAGSDIKLWLPQSFIVIGTAALIVAMLCELTDGITRLATNAPLSHREISEAEALEEEIEEIAAEIAQEDAPENSAPPIEPDGHERSAR